MKLLTLLTLTTLLTTSVFSAEPFRTTEESFELNRGFFAIVFEIGEDGKIETTKHVNQDKKVEVSDNQVALIGPLGPTRAVRKIGNKQIKYQMNIEGKHLKDPEIDKLVASLGGLEKLSGKERLDRIKLSAYKHFVPSLFPRDRFV